MRLPLLPYPYTVSSGELSPSSKPETLRAFWPPPRGTFSTFLPAEQSRAVQSPLLDLLGLGPRGPEPSLWRARV